MKKRKPSAWEEKEIDWREDHDVVVLCTLFSDLGSASWLCSAWDVRSFSSRLWLLLPWSSSSCSLHFCPCFFSSWWWRLITVGKFFLTSASPCLSSHSLSSFLSFACSVFPCLSLYLLCSLAPCLVLVFVLSGFLPSFLVTLFVAMLRQFAFHRLSLVSFSLCILFVCSCTTCSKGSGGEAAGWWGWGWGWGWEWGW